MRFKLRKNPYQNCTDLVIGISDVREWQLSVDHVVEDAAEAPDVRLEGDFHDLRTAAAATLILQMKKISFEVLVYHNYGKKD